LAVPGRGDSGAARRAHAAPDHGAPGIDGMNQVTVMPLPETTRRESEPTAHATRESAGPSAATDRFYRRVIRELHASGVEFLVGGGYALERYLGIGRLVKDLDLFLRPEDVAKALDHVGRRVRCATELKFPHW